MCCVAEARASGVPVIRSVQCRNLALGSAVVCTSALYWVLKFYAAVDNVLTAFLDSDKRLLQSAGLTVRCSGLH